MTVERKSFLRILGSLTAMSILGSVAHASEAELAISKVFASPSGWTVGQNSAGGCLAAVAESSGTAVWLGYLPNGQRILAFTNPNWTSIEVGKTYKLVLDAGLRTNWSGEYKGFERKGERGLIVAGLKTEFLQEFARGSGVNVKFEGTVITELSLKGSARALESVIECQQKYVAQSDKGGKTAVHANVGRGSKISYGTGFYVSKAGHILTNQHVVKGCARYFTVRDINKKTTKARLVAVDKVNDLALLKVDAKPMAVPPFRMKAELGERIFVYGFPEPQLLASTGNFTVGNVTALASVRDNTAELQISAPVHGGNSGGPIKDQFGNIVGVVVSKMSSAKYQTVNFGIKPMVALNFLYSNNVYPSMTSNNEVIEPTEMAKYAKKFVVQIVCK